VLPLRDDSTPVRGTGVTHVLRTKRIAMFPIVRRRSTTLRVVRAAALAQRAALPVWLAALLLTACQHSMTASLGGARAPSPAAAPSPSAAPGPSVADTVPPPEYAHEPDRGPTGDTATLVGTTVDEATRLAREKGYTGNIDVILLSEFQAGCKPKTVCRVSPRLWEMLGGKMLTLYVNRDLTITTPN
jgi:hypothetical protein